MVLATAIRLTAALVLLKGVSAIWGQNGSFETSAAKKGESA
jgi:hypothetical protein